MAEDSGIKALVEKVEALEQKLDAYESAKIAGVRIRMTVMIALLVAVGFHIWLFYREVTNFDRQKFLAELGARQVEMLPEVGNYAWQAVKNAYPLHREAMSAEIDRNWETLVKTVEAERDAYVTGVSNHLEGAVKARIEKALADQGVKLQNEFPELKEEGKMEKLVLNLHAAVDGAFQNVIEAKLNECVFAMGDVYDEFMKLVPEGADMESYKADPARWQDVLNSFVQKEIGAE
ncbi:MAG TPA: hypothetical protein PL033_05510 [Candidatus Brocadiia bacterium]|nr:hypothetical protein [Candidatus Brocadiia bacterium]